MSLPTTPHRAPAQPSPSRAPGLTTLTLLAILFAAVACSERPQNNPPPPKQTATTVIFPTTGAYTGAYIDFGEHEDEVSLEAIDKFETLVGQHQAVIASSSYWGEQNFPSKNVELIARHGSIPLLFWSPWDQPYIESRPPDRFSLPEILAGKWDSYIDRWADSARRFDKPLLVSWGLEMNGTWFPWSGIYYHETKSGSGGKGGKKERSGPELFRQTYRYVIKRVKARGATKILWVFHANNNAYPEEEWNTLANYYPGSDLIDILGISAYGKMFQETPWFSFTKAMERCYRELGALDPDKPMIVAEWAVGEFPKVGDKAEWIGAAFADFPSKFPRVKAAVYWHERWQNKDESFSNLRVNSSPEALAAYRQGIADPYWLSRPLAEN